MALAASELQVVGLGAYYCVARQPGRLGYLVQRQFIAKVHPPNFAQHFHADQPVFSRAKIEQNQLNTWVNLRLAEQPVLGQFSLSGNKQSQQVS